MPNNKHVPEITKILRFEILIPFDFLDIVRIDTLFNTHL